LHHKDQIIRDRLLALSDKLNVATVAWAVFAGAAACCYGSKRDLTDIDILVRGNDLEKAKAALKGLEEVDVVADLELKTNSGTYKFFMDDEMMGRIERRPLLGVQIPIIPVEDNILFKAILQRGGEMGKHDIDDIKDMLRNERIDIQYLEKRIQRYQAGERVRPLLKQLGVL
jgi:hypothetical protein